MQRKISRRALLKAGAGLGASLLLGGGMYLLPQSELGRRVKNKAQALLEPNQVQCLRQLVAQDNAAGRRIMWQAAAPMQQPAVLLQYGDEVKAYEVESCFFEDDGIEVYQYSALLDKLQGDTSYKFAIQDGEQQSDWHQLRTCSPRRDSFNMLIFPDSQSSDYSDWQQLVKIACRQHPEAELFVNMGDLVDNGEDSSQWRAWFRGVEGLAERAAFAPVLGNHECYNRAWKERLPEAYLNYFQVPDNGSADFSRYYYSFDYGPVHFISLATVDNEVEALRPGLMQEQLAWLEQDLAERQARWTVVLMHRDVLQYRIARMPERREGFSDEGVIFMPLFEKYKVDIVFTAHLHTYRNRGHILNGDHSQQGPLYILTGVAGNVRYPNLWTDHALDKFVAPQPETDNYLALNISQDSIIVRCYLPDGSQIDEVIYSV